MTDTLISLLQHNGEIDLLVENSKFIAADSLEPWQQEEIIDSPVSAFTIKEKALRASNCLMSVEDLSVEWVNSLTKKQLIKIRRQNSLFGVQTPIEWTKLWRGILKSPELRDWDLSTQDGNSIGTFQHHWYLWITNCLERYLTPMEKRMIDLCDRGYSHKEIGAIMIKEYGEEFFSPRNKNVKTTNEQVVNQYLHNKIPVKIAHAELLDMVYTLRGRR